jgi:nitroreductase
MKLIENLKWRYATKKYDTTKKVSDDDLQQIKEAIRLSPRYYGLQANDGHIDEYLNLKADTQGFNVELLKEFRNFMKVFIEGRKSGKQVWTAKQTYIALSNAIAACAELKIDSTPMEGFEAEKYNEILGLSSKGLKADVLLAIGYRSDEDKTQYDVKIRKPMESLFEIV